MITPGPLLNAKERGRMNPIQVVPVRAGSRGRVPEGAEELAVSRIRSVLGHVAKPVLSARVTLMMSADPAVAFPAAAHATVNVNGRVVRAQAVGPTMREAIEHMANRLRVRLDRTVQSPVSRRKAAHKRYLRQEVARS
jgi:ribosome-associated translation inhibitor RaiA